MSEYMVIYIGVEDGEIKGVYESNQLGAVGDQAEEVPLSVDRGALVDIDSITVSAAASSPLCRYIRHGGRWIRVCK